MIRSQVQESTSDYDKEKLQEHLTKPGGGVALLRCVAALDELKLESLTVSFRQACKSVFP